MVEWSACFFDNLLKGCCYKETVWLGDSRGRHIATLEHELVKFASDACVVDGRWYESLLWISMRPTAAFSRASLSAHLEQNL